VPPGSAWRSAPPQSSSEPSGLSSPYAGDITFDGVLPTAAAGGRNPPPQERQDPSFPTLQPVALTGVGTAENTRASYRIRAAGQAPPLGCRCDLRAVQGRNSTELVAWVR
jgi:hypothetical protein